MVPPCHMLALEAPQWVCDPHCKKRFVHGHCLVNMHYADSKTSYVIDYRLYLKRGTDGFQTKISLAQDLLSQYRDVPANDCCLVCVVYIKTDGRVRGRDWQVLDRYLQVKPACKIRQRLCLSQGVGRVHCKRQISQGWRRFYTVKVE